MRSPLAALTPFWDTVDMAAEPLVFVADDDAPAAAQLLFSPSGDVVVTDVAGQTRYTDGIDYALDRRARRLTRKAGSRIPFIQPRPGAPTDAGQMRVYTVTATYVHEGDTWRGYVPPDVSHLLPRTRTRLRHGQPLCVGVLGDSISEGYDASGFHRAPPAQAPYVGLLADGLTERHGSPLTVWNHAVAGSTSEDGRWLAAELAARHPDLVIVAFGMNDACHAEPPDFVANVIDIMRRVTEVRADVEFVLVAPMRPTTQCTWVGHGRFTPYRNALRELSRLRVAVADVTAVWDAVLERKHPLDLSGNGSNHPNDFGHRLYAQTIMRTLDGAAATA